MHVLVEARIVRVHVHDHHRAAPSRAIAREVVHEDLGELRVAEGHERERALHVARVELRARAHALLEGARERALVRAESFHALAEDHERLVDVAGFAEALAGGVCVLGALGAGEVDEREAGGLDACWVLAIVFVTLPSDHLRR